MPLSTETHGFIIDPLFSFMEDKGKTIKNGFVRVFLAGSSTPAVTYLNWNGAMNQETIQLDNSGRCATQVIGPKDRIYKVCVYDSHHSQENPILTVDNVQVLGTIMAILDGSVTTAKIADEAVTDAKIHENAVTTAKIADGAVTEGKLSNEVKLLINKNYVTPEMFGAKGDGFTDDTAALNEMLDGGNNAYVFGPGKVYNVSGTLKVYSNSFLELNNCEIHSSAKTHVIDCSGTSESHLNKIIIQNGMISAEGADNNTVDQAAAIRGVNVDNLIISNITTRNTFGDGFTLRRCYNASILNCSIGKFGRNGVSPTSGEYFIEKLTITKEYFTGANPGICFDCEPNSATESASFVIKDSTLESATFVEFYNQDNISTIKVLLDNVVFSNDDYRGLRFLANSEMKTNSIVRNCKFNFNIVSACIKFKNVTGVLFENCEIVNNTGSQSTSHHPISTDGGNNGIKNHTFKNVVFKGFYYSRNVFAFDSPIEGCSFYGMTLGLFTNRNFVNNTFVDCDVKAIEYSTSYSYEGNVFTRCDQPFTPAGGARSTRNFFGSGISQEISYTTVDSVTPVEIEIPLPATDETNSGHCYMIYVGHSHRGRNEYSGGLLAMVFYPENYGSPVINTIATYGDKPITLSGLSGKRGLKALFTNNYSGIFSYTLFG